MINNDMPTISSRCGGEVHRRTAANSEPPAKFSPVIRASSATLKPFCAACAPSTSANGTKPSIKGVQSVKTEIPMQNIKLTSEIPV